MTTMKVDGSELERVVLFRSINLPLLFQKRTDKQTNGFGTIEWCRGDEGAVWMAGDSQR